MPCKKMGKTNSFTNFIKSCAYITFYKNKKL